MDKIGSVNTNASINSANQPGQGQRAGETAPENDTAEAQRQAILQAQNGPHGAMMPANGLTAGIAGTTSANFQHSPIAPAPPPSSAGPVIASAVRNFDMQPSHSVPPPPSSASMASAKENPGFPDFEEELLTETLEGGDPGFEFSLEEQTDPDDEEKVLVKDRRPDPMASARREEDDERIRQKRASPNDELHAQRERGEDEEPPTTPRLIVETRPSDPRIPPRGLHRENFLDRMAAFFRNNAGNAADSDDSTEDTSTRSDSRTRDTSSDSEDANRLQ